MDIISHTLTGVAVGTVGATVSNGSWKTKGLIILSGGIGGALPDLDAISLWSKFDSTIGSLFNLDHSGKEIYFGKFWYSHHAAFHSVLAPCVLILLSIILRYVFRKDRTASNIITSIMKRKYALFAFFFGFMFHLLEDMPTPSGVWGGVNLFFPSTKYIGGFGKIWWWNNYDLVLIILTVIASNLLINILPKPYYYTKIKASLAVFVLGSALFLFQINTRKVDFSNSGHTTNYATFEAQSKQVQRDILGEQLFRIMTDIDNKIPLNF